MAKKRKAPYLIWRGRNYHAVLEIPELLRPHFRKRRFMKTLGTDSQRIAERRAAKLIAAWKKQIAEAEGGDIEFDDAAYWRRALRQATSEEERQSIMMQIDMEAWGIGATNVDQIGKLPSSDPDARDFYARATGARAPFTEYLDEWMATLRTTAKTKGIQRADILRFAARFKTIDAVSRPGVRRWCTSLVNDDNLTPKTTTRILSALRGYWRYLQAVNVVAEDHEPFQRLDVARQTKRDAPRSARLPFEPADVVALLEAARAKGDGQLADLIMMAMYTGARREELCSLRVEHVHGDYFEIVAAKTAAGVRTVPIHDELAPTMARLVEESTDGFVLSGLRIDRHGDRGDGIGKRFGALKTELGFSNRHVLHSHRGTIITMLERAGVPEGTVQDIVGHERSTLTGSTYSGKSTLEMKREALAKLAY